MSRGSRILPPAPDFVDLGSARILIADDVADIGHTLRSVQEFCAGKVAEVRTAVLDEKPQLLVKCEYVWRRTNKWINFPWSDKAPVARRSGASWRPDHQHRRVANSDAKMSNRTRSTTEPSW
ncbi:MAG: hypothetical protein H0U61_08065, partial [Nocardioidaceae bacterium]|nr:hypothetical protein [Nocardioidaceae bacterium]